MNRTQRKLKAAEKGLRAIIAKANPSAVRKWQIAQDTLTEMRLIDKKKRRTS